MIGVAGKPCTLKTGDAKLKLDSVRTAKRALYAKAGTTTVAPKITPRPPRREGVRAGHRRQRRPQRRATRSIRITLRHIYRQRSRKGRGLAIDATPRR